MSEINTESVQQLFDAGVHIGYSKARRHPSAQNFIHTTKTRGDIINIEETDRQIIEAEEFLKELTAGGKQVLLVGTKPEASAIIKNMADKLDLPYVQNRWIGGTLTNASEIDVRIKRLRTLLDQQEKGELIYQTKKEKLMLEREIDRLKIKFGGLLNMTGKPAALIIVDSLSEDIAITEAQKTGVPTVSISNTDCDLKKVTYPIIANDAARSAIQLIINRLGEALKK
ncbi:MAG: 30S ribosomal protein S2 [Candidatus Nomurabacteria bacterium]|nr:30S ribosomal protein S2 [Candidatus Nomurabacteria bacterium]